MLQVLSRWQTPGGRLLAALPLLKQVAPRCAETADVSNNEASFDILDIDVQEAAPGTATVFSCGIPLGSLPHVGSCSAVFGSSKEAMMSQTSL